jgi:hypothetical protein
VLRSSWAIVQVVVAMIKLLVLAVPVTQCMQL